MYFTVLGCVFAARYAIEARERDAHASRLAAQLAEARLSALRGQLHPHFLFNSLNAIAVLVRERNTAAATRMLELLSDVLRQLLRGDRAHEVTLAVELAFVEQYLAIEQVRFSDRLRVEWMLDDGVWMIGWCMILMAAAVHLPARVIGTIGVAMIALHNLTDVFNLRQTSGDEGPNWLLTILYFGGAVPLGSSARRCWSSSSSFRGLG